jgi:hypothetical protein
MSAYQDLLDLHAGLLETNAYCYFELAYTRRTDWMAWLCSNHRDDDPNREVICNGQGATPEEACRSALKNYHQRQNKEVIPCS